MNSRSEVAFQKKVYAHYREYGRDFPWRKTTDPYNILVSEIMLQQTQVERVVAKYRSFLKQFPTVRVLASAPLADVLRAWQGLGYNRRARMLHECAKAVVEEYGGKFPKTHRELNELPGIGPYTAGAVLAFAYNSAVPIIETNIRTVFLRHFFEGKEGVSDKEIFVYIDATLDRKHPRAWYAALMDYGAYLKKKYGNQNVRSRHYTKQSAFKGSGRQIRGAILRALGEAQLSEILLMRALGEVDAARVRTQLAALLREGLISKKGRSYQLGS